MPANQMRHWLLTACCHCGDVVNGTRGRAFADGDTRQQGLFGAGGLDFLDVGPHQIADLLRVDLSTLAHL